MTVITHVEAASPETLLVRGATSDDYDVKPVTVNGRPARATAANFAEWELELPVPPSAGLRLTAQSEDAHGNVEPRPHVRDHFAGPRSEARPLTAACNR